MEGKRMENFDFAIADAQLADAEGMGEVFYKGWLATYPNEEHRITLDDIEDRWKNRNSPERLARRREQLAHPHAGEKTLVAKIGEKIVGVCRVMKHADKNQLQAIYVLPEYHEVGIGTKLWQEAQGFLDPTQHTIVEVVVYNHKAVKFYESLGFKDTGKRMADPRFTMKSGAVIPEMEMRKEAVTAP